MENSTNSGYSLSYAYSLLSAGEHSITAVAHSELGATTEVTNTFTVVKFPSSDYITNQTQLISIVLVVALETTKYYSSTHLLKI
ncbi:MAG: hypothetical protein CM15mP74_30700 [Halieaceae bacterium]|nr:MAG: hypothetical protein CM15mP74_30700 [Halieaceae bacterium]